MVDLHDGRSNTAAHEQIAEKNKEIDRLSKEKTAFERVSPDLIKSWFAHCGYS